jgi:hypothetical protein
MTGGRKKVLASSAKKAELHFATQPRSKAQGWIIERLGKHHRQFFPHPKDRAALYSPAPYNGTNFRIRQFARTENNPD